MPHIVAVHNVLRWIYGVFSFDNVISKAPVFISANSDPEPDVCVFGRTIREYMATGNLPITEAVLLVEVSDSTLEYDMTTKADLYARAGVSEYWVLGIAGRRLNIFTAPQNGSYPAPRTLGEADTAVPTAKPDMSVRVADLLP
ncbi:MAG: Uma2 family endonuclease [Armatimonadetes bacterium]|nr:Uma2 family endonuclease [Armatimonadota bacterium]